VLYKVVTCQWAPTGFSNNQPIIISNDSHFKKNLYTHIHRFQDYPRIFLDFFFNLPYHYHFNNNNKKCSSFFSKDFLNIFFPGSKKTFIYPQQLYQLHRRSTIQKKTILFTQTFSPHPIFCPNYMNFSPIFLMY